MVMGQPDTYEVCGRTLNERLIAPTAFSPLAECMAIQKTGTALDVIRNSGTQWEIIAAPGSVQPSIDMEIFEADIASREQIQAVLGRNGRTFITALNTARSESAEQAVERAKENKLIGAQVIKLEVFEPTCIDGADTLIPIDSEVLRAAKILLQEGYYSIPFINPDEQSLKTLLALNIRHVRAYAGYIGLNRGIEDICKLSRFIQRANALGIFVIAEGGFGTPEHAQTAMELGAGAVLVNAGIAKAHDPGAIAVEFRTAVQIGRINYLKRRAT